MLGLRQLSLLRLKHGHVRSFRSSTIGMIPASDVLPPIHRLPPDAKVLDRALFHRSVTVHAARIPAQKTGPIVKALRSAVLNAPKTRTVISERDDPDSRLILLDFKATDEIPTSVLDLLKAEEASLDTYEVHFNYDFWTADDILQSILPESLCANSPTGFAATGHLAHLNLNDEYLPYKYIIGQIILDKNPRIRTVVNKLSSIHAQFRFFDMELIAGDPEYVVQHRESDCQFTFDFREVYWNSRLSAEHERLIHIFKPEDGIVADVMAGVGPFAVPAARRGCAVLANDLNPACAKWHRKNVADNNVSENLRVFCEDGSDFIRVAFRRAYEEPFPAFTGLPQGKRKQNRGRRQKQEEAAKADSPLILPVRNKIRHFVMNLPDSAIDFLGAFRGVLSQSNPYYALYEDLPMVHCYCFTRFLERDDAIADIKKRVETALGGPLENEVDLHYVRSVAPNKDMYCISFRLPRAVALGVQ